MAQGNFGERLKREREMREVTLDEITAATRIGTRFLTALENEDWDKLPGGVFNRGFVRAIARYLGLDEEDLLAEYDVAYSARAGSPPPSPPELPTSRSLSRAVPALVVLLIFAGAVVGGYFGWKRLRALRRAPETTSVQAPAPSAQAPSAAAASPAASPASATESTDPLHLSLSASQSVHVRVTADGKDVFDGEAAPGQTLHFDAQEKFVVSASNSTAVLLELNGQAMPPVGVPGSSGKMVLTRKDLTRAPDGNTQR
jgi:cytoskeletal protein RodZ